MSKSAHNAENASKRRSVLDGKKGSVRVTAIVAALSGVVALVGGALGLWDDIADRMRADRPQITATPNPLRAWHEDFATCPEPSTSVWFDEPLVLRDYSRPIVSALGAELRGEVARAGDKGGPRKDGRTFSEISWTTFRVHEGVYDVPESDFDLKTFEDAGAIQVGPRYIDLDFFNPTDDVLRIVDVGLEVERLPVPTGTLYVPAPYGGGDRVRVMTFDLRDENPQALAFAEGCTRKPFFATYSLEVEPGKGMILGLRVEPADCLCRFRFRIDYVDDRGRRSAITVPDRNQPPLLAVGITKRERFGMYYQSNTEPGGPGYTKYDCRQDPESCTRPMGYGR
ncbi:hypothetical protein [Nocardia lijiangensis]|uniref:hypothetical protein n=1 Tax=Nocardia lijiangensis TaxID=299618 RepID=UPI000AB446A5|nr:hypothetical protein [Nocardia lijiangensis]